MDEEMLIEDASSIKLIINTSGGSGLIWLSSLYGSYDYISDVRLPGDGHTTFLCPHCLQDLATEKKCHLCNANIVTLRVTDGSSVSFCSRNGCKKHFVEYDDYCSALKKIEHDHESNFDDDEDLFTEDALNYNEPILY